MYTLKIIASTVLLSLAVQASAADVTGLVQTIQSYPGHTGILIRLQEPVQNPDSCAGTAWYIFPDDSPRAALVQSMILTAYAKRERITFTLSGCHQNYPAIVVVTSNAP